MEYPTYADAKDLAEQEAEHYTSKHPCELTARLVDEFNEDDSVSHDSLGWCALFLFDAVGDSHAPAEGAAIIWEHDDGRVTLEEFGDYAEVYAAWTAHYLTRWDDDTTDSEETE